MQLVKRASFVIRYISFCLLFLVFLAACSKEDDSLTPTATTTEPTVQAQPQPTNTTLAEVPTVDTAIASTVTPETASKTITRRIEPRDCKTYNPAVGEEEGQSYRCGVMFVPQDRNQGEGLEIEIKFAILKSVGGEPTSDPMLFLSGGPGNSALYPDGFVELAHRFAPMRQTRDIILFDQRGVGASAPAINCTTVTPIQDEDRKAALLDQYEATTGIIRSDENQFTVDCVLNLWNQGIDLDQYTSAASAADTVDLMRALQETEGYQSYNLYGISYGTRLAETIARDFPEFDLIRTITMDSVFPRPEGEYEASYYIGKHEMFESVFAACAGDGACATAYPDLLQRFNDLVNKLNEQPLALPDETMLSGDQLYQFMFPFDDRGPTWIPRIPYLPRMIIELEEGISETYLGLRDGTLPPQAPSPDIPESVYETMDLLSNCTAVTAEADKNEIYRQLFNIQPEKRASIVSQLCSQDEAQSVMATMDKMKPEDLNEVVKRLYISDFRSTSPFVRTQFNCNEAFPFGESPEVLESKMHDAAMPQFLIDGAVETVNQAAETCQMWPSGVSPAFEIEPVGAQNRALLLNGQWDYVTYPKWAEAVHQRWPASDYVFMPNGMHSLLSNYGECPTNVTMQFLNDPTQTLDVSCTAEMKVEWIYQ